MPMKIGVKALKKPQEGLQGAFFYVGCWYFRRIEMRYLESNKWHSRHGRGSKRSVANPCKSLFSNS